MYTEAWVVLTCGNDTVYNRVLERVQHSVVPSDPRRIRKEGTRIEFPVSVETQRATTQARILGQRFLEDRLDPQDRREVEMSVRTKVKEQKLTEGTSFTPGPWTLEAGRTIQTRSGKFHLAYRTDPQTSEKEFSSPTELDANARLIAAAPDLLNACVAMGEKVPWVHNAGVTEDIEALRAVCLAYADVWNNLMSQAIDKAGGQSVIEYNTKEAHKVVGAITESTHSRPTPRLRPLKEAKSRAEIEKEQKLTEGTSFTPGPWETHLNPPEDKRIPGSYQVNHAGTHQWIASEVSPRDARLIVMAPDMFDLLQSALSLWGFMVNDPSLSQSEREAAQRKLEKARQVVGAIIESVHSRPAPRLRPLRERMTRAEIESEFDIQYGLIKDPGKFEGEPVYAPYFYDLWMESGSDEDVYGADDTIHSVFFITDEDREQFPELKEEEIEALHVWEGETGFFNTEAVTREEWEAFKAQHESDEDEEFAESHNRPDSVRPPQTGETVYVGDVEIEFTRGGWYVAYHMAKDSDGEFLKKMKFDTWASALEYANSVADDEDFEESCRKGKKGKRVAPKLRGKSQSDGKPQKVEAKPLSRTPQDHQTAIAIRTLKMAAPMAGVMGGPSKEEARRYLLSIGWSQAKIDALTNSQSSRKEASQKVQQKVESLTISEPTITQKRLLRTLLTVMAQEPRDHAILTPMPGSNVPSGYPNVSMAMWQSLSRNQLAKKAHNGVWYLTQRGSDALTNSQSSRKEASQKVQQESVVSEKKRKIDYGRLHQQGAKPETFNMPQHTVKGE